jgi:hypothetical protein
MSQLKYNPGAIELGLSPNELDRLDEVSPLVEVYLYRFLTALWYALIGEHTSVPYSDN